jgi:flagellar protein FliO/FliZ
LLQSGSLLGTDIIMSKKTNCITLFTALCFSGWSVAALAAPQNQVITAEMDSYMRVIWGLLIVIGIIFVIYALFKKKFSLLTTSPTRNINILEMKPLMGKKAICLVRVRNREYLLGIGDNTITLLDTLSQSTDTDFASVMRQARGEKTS